MQNDNLLLLNYFTQNIPCHARRYFLEHVLGNDLNDKVFGSIHKHLPKVEVEIESLQQPGPKFSVEVTNEENETYFSGAGWMEFVTKYKMKVGDKVYFFLIHADHMTYFKYVDPSAQDSSDEDA